MKIKKAILNMILNERQKSVIRHALIYSDYVYRKRGKVDEAAAVKRVIDEIQPLFFEPEKKYSVKEVREIVNDVIDKAVDLAIPVAFKHGFTAAVDTFKKRLKPMGVIDLKNCEDCKEKNGCMVRSAILEAEEDERQKNEKVKSEGHEIKVEDGSETEQEKE